MALTFSNPATSNVKLQLLQVEGNEGETVTAKVSVYKGCGNNKKLYLPREGNEGETIIAKVSQVPR